MTLNPKALKAAKAAFNKTYVDKDGPLRGAITAYLAASQDPAPATVDEIAGIIAGVVDEPHFYKAVAFQTAAKAVIDRLTAPVPPVVGEDAVEAVEAVAKLVDLVIDEVLGPSVEDEPDNESVGSSMDGPLPMTFGHVREARDAIPVLRAALASSVAKPCGVKALEWREGDDTDNSTAIGTVNAQTPFGKYVCSNDGWFLWANGTQWIEAANRYAGRAAAQADYERRILSCLSHPAQGWREPEGWKSKAADDVFAERQRQVEAEGWTPEHDDEHTNGELAAAATCYAFTAARSAHHIYNYVWPWSSDWWKPNGKRRNLVKAGALILAEIERLDRLPSAPAGGSGNE